eukprot:CAMPEP_0182888814 /NCGR_PEP_ID=MMETSP0034_2-20130328/21666_1 /TAXON_ID=156128 /ORGANISM="Nephroselmis pyriformis, Strain CCMP717" /LENGTH=934 /DNA_ID=CAMNT_0025022269 /DNA_START=70 /DNA_END=2871 /DNA_ORIENTATION=+
MEPTRLLLAAADLASNGTDLHDLHGDDHGGGHGSHPFTFEELIALIGTLWVIMLFGKIAGRIGLPPLVGEIMSGILVGPHGIDLAPRPTSLMLIGEVGLLLMVLEAGIEVDLSQLALVGGRGVMVAVFGSLVPLLIGFSLAMACFDMEYKNALAVGATLAPTSMGISLKVLQEGGVLNTPTGQLIIAAAVIDDVIALVLLSELEALEDPSIANFIIPIVASLAFILGVGVAAIKFVPGFLAKQVVPRLPAKHVEVVLLGMVLAVGAGLTAGVHYGRSSHLLGAFLGGLCFCTLHSVEEIWRRKVRDIMAWLVRVFFACTIGFEVPIRDLWTAKIVTRAVVFLLAGIGKLATGFFARPLNFRDGATIGWAMSAWGEFAFIVATTARELGSLDEETYGAVILAVLLSTIYSPLMTKTVCNMKPGSGITSMFPVHILRPVLPILPKKIRQMVADEMQRITLQSEMADVPDFQVLNRIGSELNLVGRHSVYYAATVRCRSSWGLTDRLLNSIRESMTIVDFRVSTSGGFTQFLLYLCDKDLLASPDETPEQLEEINRRCAERRRQIRDVLGGSHENVDEKTGHGADNITVLLERWKPVLDDDDTDGTEAFEQADMALRTEERVSATQGRSTGTTTADGKAAMKRMTRAGSMKSIRDMVQSDVDLGLFNAIEKGRVEREKNSVKTRTDIGFGAMQAIQSGRPRARLPFAAATGGIRTRAGGASLDLVGRNSFRMSPDPAGSPELSRGNAGHGMTIGSASGGALAKELKRKIEIERERVHGSASASPAPNARSSTPDLSGKSPNSSGMTPTGGFGASVTTVSGATSDALRKELIVSDHDNLFRGMTPRAANKTSANTPFTRPSIPTFSGDNGGVDVEVGGSNTSTGSNGSNGKAEIAEIIAKRSDAAKPAKRTSIFDDPSLFGPLPPVEEAPSAPSAAPA